MTQVMSGQGATVPPAGLPPANTAGVGSGVGQAGSGVAAQIATAVPANGVVGGLTGYTNVYLPVQPIRQALSDQEGFVSTAWRKFFARLITLVANSYPPGIGEVRQSVANTLDNSWLLCNGASPETASYPKLSALLIPVTGAGATAGTFNLPNVPTANSLMTFIKAL